LGESQAAAETQQAHEQEILDHYAPSIVFLSTRFDRNTLQPGLPLAIFQLSFGTQRGVLVSIPQK